MSSLEVIYVDGRMRDVEPQRFAFFNADLGLTNGLHVLIEGGLIGL